MTTKNEMFIELEFPFGYFASSDDERTKPEWPPTPARLYSALVAAHHNRLRLDSSYDGEKYEKALLWLEEHLPYIWFGKQISDSNFPTVPVPLSSSKNKKKLLEPQLRMFPRVHASTKFVYFGWPGVESEHWSTISELLPYISVVGSGRSMVLANKVVAVPDKGLICWKPVFTGRKSLNGYAPGRLRELNDMYESEGFAFPGLPVRYEEVGLHPVEPKSAFSDFFIYQLNGSYRIPIAQAANVADRVRSELLRICSHKKDPMAITGSGGANRPHLAYLPLPFVGSPHGDGGLYGVGIGIPKEIDAEERSLINSTLSKLCQIQYRDKIWTLDLDFKSTANTLDRKTWVGPSRFWRSVTPAEVLINFKSHKQIKKNAAQMGFPKVIAVSTSKYPYFLGSKFSREFVSRNVFKKKRKDTFLIHYAIEFAEPVMGPISFGMGANFGLGLAKPVASGKVRDSSVEFLVNP